MKIILPLPPSDNERLIVAWRQRRMILSKKYRDYKKVAQMEIMRQVDFSESPMPLFTPTFENQMEIRIYFFLKDKRRDASDMLKCLLDVMKTLIYTDDKWVIPIFYAPYRIEKENPRVEVCFYG